MIARDSLKCLHRILIVAIGALYEKDDISMLPPAITDKTPEGSGGGITHFVLISCKRRNVNG